MKDIRWSVRAAMVVLALTMAVGKIQAADDISSQQLYANAMQSSITAQREFRRALPSIYAYSQTAHAVTQSNITSDTAMAAVAACPTTMCAPNSQWVMWDVPFSVRATKKQDNGYRGFDENISGFATGISRMLNDSTAIGLALGYDHRKMDGRDSYYMKNRGDAFHAAIFGGTAIGCLFLDAYAGYSRTWNESERDVYPAGGGWSRSSADFNDTILSAGMKISHVIVLPSEFRITPSVGLDYSHIRFGGAAEEGAASRLNLEKDSANQLAVPLMAAVNYTFSSSWLSFGGAWSVWTPEVRAGYVPVLGDRQIEATGRNYVAGTAPDAIKSAKIGSYGDIGGGVKLKIRDKYIFSLDYDYRFADKYTNHTVTASYGVSF